MILGTLGREVAVSLLVVNAGSSSLKFALFDAEASRSLARGIVDWTDPDRGPELVVRSTGGPERRIPHESANHDSAASLAIHALFESDDPEIGRLSDLTAIGHRVVHGGVVFQESVLIDEGVKAELARLSELAPLHNPPALAAMQAVERVLPRLPHVAVFDTSYYTQLKPAHAVYPLPYHWYTNWGIRKFGFHGISHAYCAQRAAEWLHRDPSSLKIVSCHLGNGCSATATSGGIAVDTTMGYTPMDGLMMGTRSGSVDPGILLHVQRHKGLTVDQLDDALNHQSGLLGVSGISSDFRAIGEAASRGQENAILAIQMYAARVRSAIGSLTATLGGIDVLIFTAGIGENSSTLRAEVCRGLECLGLALDPSRNASCQPDADVARDDSTARILVLRTHEDLMIARETRHVCARLNR